MRTRTASQASASDTESETAPSSDDRSNEPRTLAVAFGCVATARGTR